MDIQEEIERVRTLLPNEPLRDCYDVMIRRGFLQENVLIYSADWILQGEKKGRAVKLKCTACGGERHVEHRTIQHQRWRGDTYTECGFVHPVTGETMGSYTTTICLFCGEPVSTRHRAHMSPYISDVTVMSIHNLEGYLAFITWSLDKNADKDGTVYYTHRAVEAAVLIGKRFVRYNKSINWWGGGYSVKPTWEARKRFDDMIDKVGFDHILPFDANDILQSTAGKSALEIYLAGKEGNCYPIKYLRAWLRYPTIENLVRSGAAVLVNDHMRIGRTNTTRGKTGFDYDALADINFKKAKPHEMLGVQKEEYAKVCNMTANEFRFYKLMRERGVEEIDEMLIIYHNEKFSNPVTFFTQNPQIPIVHTMRYLRKQRAKAAENKTLIGFSYLKDYWNLVDKVQGTLDETIRFPKNLIREHDRFVARYKEKENEILSSNIAKRASTLAKLAFADEELGLMIRPAASHAELISEGKELHHCVATYAKSVAKGETAILFIRKIQEPDKPFFTLEYKNGKVVQNRGKRNCARTPEVQEFEKRWLDNLKGEKRHAG